MMKMSWIGMILISAVSACSGSAISSPDPTDGSISLTATPALHSTTTSHPEQPSDLEYSSVAEALADLKTRDGVSIRVLQGWTIIIEADGTTNWSFVPPDHPAYPAVARRVLYRDQDGWHLKMDVLCEAEPAACDQFIRDFEALNAPIYQFIEHQQRP